MPQDANIFGNTVAARCFESQILKASRNPMLRGRWQLSRKSSSKIKLLGALPLRVLFCPVWGERRGHTKDLYAKGRLKPNAYFDIFYVPRGQNSRILLGKSLRPKGQFQDASWGVCGSWVLRQNIQTWRYDSGMPSSYNFKCKTRILLFSSRSTSKAVNEWAVAFKDSVNQKDLLSLISH